MRQGCPLSPYLFIIAPEIVANSVRAEKNFKGYVTYDEKLKISQFADDTTLFLDGSEECFQNSLKLLDLFGFFSGLKVNYENTKAFNIGSSINRSPLAGRDEITLETSKVFALGIWFSTNRADMLSLNYQERIDKINNVEKLAV